MIELLTALVLVVEDLDDLLTVHHLLDIAFGSAESLLLADEVLGRAASYVLGHDHHDDHAGKEHERHPDAVVEHHADTADDDQQGLDNLGQSHGNKLS